MLRHQSLKTKPNNLKVSEMEKRSVRIVDLIEILKVIHS